MKTKILCLILTLCVMLTCAAGTSAATAEQAPTAQTDYCLAQRCEDGVILHCFNWTLAQIKAELPQIAAAGFTAVQTSPLQPHSGGGQWYWLYQPTNFTVGNELGSYNDLKDLCAEADKYGVKIIVDVVANHLAGGNNGSWGNIDGSLRKSEYFHNEGPCEDKNNRYDLTHKNIGMPDLNSENTAVQDKVIALLNSLKSAGVDGFRWDAAKHIGLPSEDCAFWERVSAVGLYQYGEILDAPAGKSDDDYNNDLIAEYAQYIGVTDETYSATVTEAIRDKRVAKSKGNWLNRGVGADRIVYWGESHDTYANDDGWTKELDQNVIDRAYAILAARAQSQALYLSRPYETGYTAIMAARKGSTHFTSPEVAAVNRFHNAMIGAAETPSTSSGCYVICRSGGAVVVSPNKQDVDVTVTNAGSLVPQGTYVDEVSGSTWTVTAAKMTGHIGSSGVAVFYDPDYQDRQGVLVGDADLSGEVTILDATAIQRSLAGLEQLSDEAVTAADADRDGELAILDATAIQRWLAGFKENDAIGTFVS